MNVAFYLKEQSELVDQALDRLTSARTDRSPEWMPFLLNVPDHLLEAMRYSLMAGGKRLRPILLITAAGMFNVSADTVMPAACALEMIHTYSLIHDDLPCMDDDDLRRGKPTNHKVYGDAMATLAGDALLTMAFELLGKQGQVPGIGPTETARVVVETAMAAGAAGMVGGQAEDLVWEGQAVSAQQLESIHRLKTGALFKAALRCGAILGGASAAELNCLDRFASHFGMAFQIQDDLLDVVGDVAKTGKGIGRDQRHRKSTYVSYYGVDGARDRARTEVAAAQLALQPFGHRALILTDLAKFVIDREL